MCCLRCRGFMVLETVFAQGYWLQQCRCVNCGDIQCIREPIYPIAKRKTGRGKDNRRRQHYGTSTKILKLSGEEWDHCHNQDLAKRFDVSPTWIAQLRCKCGKSKRYKSRGLDRVNP